VFFSQKTHKTKLKTRNNIENKKTRKHQKKKKHTKNTKKSKRNTKNYTAQVRGALKGPAVRWSS
jgi:hypothetical protein